MDGNEQRKAEEAKRVRGPRAIKRIVGRLSIRILKKLGKSFKKQRRESKTGEKSKQESE